jgi:hypothetical protein
MKSKVGSMELQLDGITVEIKKKIGKEVKFKGKVSFFVILMNCQCPTRFCSYSSSTAIIQPSIYFFLLYAASSFW